MALNIAVLNKDVQEYILKHLKTDITSLVLKGSSFSDVTIQEIAQQIEGLKKIQSKAPSFLKDGVLFPPKLNLEQSSSEETALYKRELLKDYDSFIDCTGGFGIDTFYLSQNDKKNVYCELNESLTEIVAHNFKTHNINVECISTNGVEYVLNSTDCFDVIYLDPSRRSEKGKVIALDESEPNLLLYWNDLLQKCNRLMVKLSPMLDIHYLLRELPCIEELHVVSVKNDVKEIILLANKEFNGEPKLIASELSQGNSFSYANENDRPTISSDVNQKYIYEPFGALLKTNLQDAYANELKLEKVAYKSNFYVSNELVKSPLLKTFEVVEQFDFNKKTIKKKVGKEPIQVVCRNFPLQPEQVQKLLKVKHGGNRFLICTQAVGEQKVCFIVKRILN